MRWPSLYVSTCFSQAFILRFSDCTYVMRPTASEVLPASSDCCSSSLRDLETCARHTVESWLSNPRCGGAQLVRASVILGEVERVEFAVVGQEKERTWLWNVAISLPSRAPNLPSTSLCHESYLSVTLDWTLP